MCNHLNIFLHFTYTRKITSYQSSWRLEVKNFIFIIVSSVTMRKRKKRLSLNFRNFVSAALNMFTHQHQSVLHSITIRIKDIITNSAGISKKLFNRCIVVYLAYKWRPRKMKSILSNSFFFVFATNSNNVNSICINIS